MNSKLRDNSPRKGLRWSALLLLAGFLLGSLLPSLSWRVKAAPHRAVVAGDVVISEFRTVGPTGTDDEFIEIFNRTNMPVDMGGWELRRSTDSGKTYNLYYFPIGFSLEAGRYYLIADPDYSGSVAADDTYSSSTSVANAGGIGLLDMQNNVVDQAGMSPGSEYLEGNHLVELSAHTDQSYQRADNGCVDTDDNDADFVLQPSANPQNLASTPIKCLSVVRVSSDDDSPPSYTIGNTVAIDVEFSSKVNVTGFPALLLETGTTDRSAIYSSINDLDTILTFSYTVQGDDVSADLDYVANNSLSLNGGTIIGAVGDADLTLPEPGSAKSLGGDGNIVIDNGVDPTTISFTRQLPLSEITSADILTFRVTFSEPVKNVDETDFSVCIVPESGTATATINTASPINAPKYASIYDVEVSSVYSSNFKGAVELNFNGVTGIVDGDSHAIPSSDPDIDEVYSVENTSPTVTVERALTQDPSTDTVPVQFTVIFSEKISLSSFTVDDITQDATQPGAISAASIKWSITDTGDATTFTVAAEQVAENGTIVPIIEAFKVKDLAGNDNEASSSTNYKVDFNDDVSPTVIVEQASTQSDPASILPVDFTVTFSEPIIASIFTSSDIAQNGTATGVTWSITNSGDDKIFTLSAIEVTEAGTLKPSIDVNKVTDFIGNENEKSTSVDNIVELLPEVDATTRTLLINEVAWSGTNADPDDQWIELYNPGDIDINLTGWYLKASDGYPNIQFTSTSCDGGPCVLRENKFFLLERDDDNTVKNKEADFIFTDTLETAGEYLKLYSSDNTLVDTANSNGGAWPAGSEAESRSMERSGNVADSSVAWFTFAGNIMNGEDAKGDPIYGTPKEANWAIGVIATPSPVPTRTPIPPSATPTPYPFQSVVLNEVLARPGHDWNGDGVVNANDEYIEIINRGNSAVNLQGWRLDDEYEQGSPAYSLPSLNLAAGERIAIYGYTSHISLSDGGDTVRLLKYDGTIADAVTYTVIKKADQPWCRFPEDSFWRTDCFPTPNEANALYGENNANLPASPRIACSLPDTVPDYIILMECGHLGMDIYNLDFWNQNLSSIWRKGRTRNFTWFR